MRVLFIGAHPDDIEISCCGTLAKCVKRGDRVVVCHVANGNMGHEIIKPDCDHHPHGLEDVTPLIEFTEKYYM